MKRAAANCAFVAGIRSEKRSVASAVRTAEPSPRATTQFWSTSREAVTAALTFVSLASRSAPEGLLAVK